MVVFTKVLMVSAVSQQVIINFGYFFNKISRQDFQKSPNLVTLNETKQADFAHIINGFASEGWMFYIVEILFEFLYFSQKYNLRHFEFNFMCTNYFKPNIKMVSR